MGFDDDFEQGSLGRRLTSPFRRLLRWMASFGGDGESFGRSASDESTLKAVLLFPIRIALAFIQFLIFNWSSSRNGRSFVLALPALGVLGLLIAELSVAVWRLESTQSVFYENRYAYYMTNDAEFARCCAAKLIELDPSPQNKFKLGQAYTLQEDLLSAMDVIQTIAPDDQPGYSLAHFWIANRAIADPTWKLTEAQRKETAIRHFTYAFELEKETNSPHGIDSMVRLAEFKVLDKDLEGAAETLHGVLDKKIETVSHLQAIIRLLQVYKELGRNDEIVAAAAQLEPRLYNLAMGRPDMVEPWESLVAILAQADRYDQAEEYIGDALALAKNPNTIHELRKVRANLYLRRALSIKDTSSRENYSNRFVYLAQSIAVYPLTLDAYRYLIEYIDLNAQNPDEEELIRLSMGTSQVPWVVHTILGLRDAQRGDWPSADNHWSIASGQSDQISTYIGMLLRECLRSKALTNTETVPILEHSRKSFPKHPILNLTKADLLIADKEFAQAEPLLKELIETYPTLLDARESYAKVLDELGRPGEAEAEREKTKQLVLESRRARQGNANASQ